jgi:hypothetical protein
VESKGDHLFAGGGGRANICLHVDSKGEHLFAGGEEGRTSVYKFAFKPFKLYFLVAV